MSKDPDYRYIHHELHSSRGTSTDGRVYISISTKTGKSEVIVEQTIKQRMPVTDVEKAVDSYKALNVKSGRRLITIDDLIELN